MDKLKLSFTVMMLRWRRGQRLLSDMRENVSEMARDLKEGPSKCRAAILCAVQNEYDAVQSYFKQEEALLSKGAIGFKSQKDADGSFVVVLLLRGMGNISAALGTQYAIDVWRPQFLLLVGIAGGFAKPGRDLGDVLVADQLIYYELGKQSDKGTTLRPQVFRPSAILVSAAQSIAAKPHAWIEQIKSPRPDGTSERYMPKVHLGTILSGDKVVTSKSFLKEFRNTWSGILGVEMEGAGAGLAVYRSETQPEFLMIKAICDWADKSKKDEWQKYAAHASAAFAFVLLNNVLLNKMSSNASGQVVPQRKLHVTCDGPAIVEICDRLYQDWQEIADYYRIKNRERARFKAGREMVEIWNWLVDRRNLDSIPAMLYWLDRPDILRDFPCLNPVDGSQGLPPNGSAAAPQP
jgi:nucleoside phosphorylase